LTSAAQVPHRELLTLVTVQGGVRCGRWDTGGVGWAGLQVRRLPAAARLVLLAAVLAGLFGMHVLTADHDSGRHGTLPMSMPGDADMSGHADISGPSPAGSPPIPVMDAMGSAPGSAVATAADPGSGGGDHGEMAGCILFLVVGGAALILLLLRYRNGRRTTGLGRLAGLAVTDMRRRGPPRRWPRLSLCVIRV